MLKHLPHSLLALLAGVLALGVYHAHPIMAAEPPVEIKLEQFRSVSTSTICVSVDGTLLGVRRRVDEKDLILLIDTETGKTLHTIGPLSLRNKPEVVVLAISPDKKRVGIVATKDDVDYPCPFAIEVWDVVSGKRVMYVADNVKDIAEGFYESRCLAFSPDGKKLAVGCRPVKLGAGIDPKDSVWVWDIEKGKVESDFLGGNERGRYNERSLNFTSDGKTILARDENCVLMFDVATGKQKVSGPDREWRKTNSLQFAEFSPDKNLLVTRSVSRTTPATTSLDVWDTTTGRLKSSIKPVLGVEAVSPDARWWVGRSGKDEFKLCDLESGKEVASFPVKTEGRGIRVWFSGDGKRLAVLSENTIRWTTFPAENPKKN